MRILLFLAFVLYPPLALSTVNDAIVKQWIAASLTTAGKPLPTSSDVTILPDNGVDALNYAWGRLKLCRDSGKSLDLNLAAAEHYMFARYIANDTGDTMLREAPKWYEQFKSFSTNELFQKFLQTTDQPTSPVDADVRRWGEAGVERGLKEYSVRTKQDASAKTSAATIALGIAGLFYYSKYTPPEKMECDVAIAPIGKWESVDPGKRWRLEFAEGTVTWTEFNSTTGAKLVRIVPVQNYFMSSETLRIERANDAETLSFLGFTPTITKEIISRDAHASYMLIKRNGTDLTVEWFGLSVIKDTKGNFQELKQPGSTPAKPFLFRPTL